MRERREDHAHSHPVIIEDGAHPRASLQTQSTMNGHTDRPRIISDDSAEGARQHSAKEK